MIICTRHSYGGPRDCPWCALESEQRAHGNQCEQLRAAAAADQRDAEAELARVKEELERLQQACAKSYTTGWDAAQGQVARLQDGLNRTSAKLFKAEAELAAARPVLAACEKLVISTDAIGPLHLKGKPQIVSSTQALAEAEWARRKSQREGGGNA